jgi:hypothetical protein
MPTLPLIPGTTAVAVAGRDKSQSVLAPKCRLKWCQTGKSENRYHRITRNMCFLVNELRGSRGWGKLRFIRKTKINVY